MLKGFNQTYLKILMFGCLGINMLFANNSNNSNAKKLFDKGNQAYENKNFKEALNFYKKSCELGFKESCRAVGSIYFEGKADVNKDYHQSLNFEKKACELGSGLSCVRVGAMYKYGKGAVIDMQKAFIYFQKGLELKEPDAYGFLANLYLDGKYVTQDYHRAFAYATKGCKLQSTLSCSALGFMYENGYGVGKDLEQASVYYQRACKLGSENGCEKYKELVNQR